MMNTIERRAAPSLVEYTNEAIIIAYKESTSRLEEFLAGQGFKVTVSRQEDDPGLDDYSATIRCMLNHESAWRFAMSRDVPVLVVEADFVPVREFGRLPLPFPIEEHSLGISWLYTTAAQVYSVDRSGFAQGYSTSAVCYLVSPSAAGVLNEYSAQVLQECLGAYSPWDSGVERRLRERGFRNFIPYRCYGEHGGQANPEHKIRRNHRADSLLGPLAFAPQYARKPDGRMDGWALWRERLYGRIYGLGRLAAGKFLRPKVMLKSSTPGRLFQFAVFRLLAP